MVNKEAQPQTYYTIKGWEGAVSRVTFRCWPIESLTEARNNKRQTYYRVIAEIPILPKCTDELKNILRDWFHDRHGKIIIAIEILDIELRKEGCNEKSNV